jgi:hypothetical protein
MQVTNESIEGMIQQIEDYVSNFTPLKGDLEMIECLRELLDRRRREEWISAKHGNTLMGLSQCPDCGEFRGHGHECRPSAPTKEGAE